MWRVLIDIHGKFFMDKLRKRENINQGWFLLITSTIVIVTVVVTSTIWAYKLWKLSPTIQVPAYCCQTLHFFQIQISMINVWGTFCKNQSLNRKIDTSNQLFFIYFICFVDIMMYLKGKSYMPYIPVLFPLPSRSRTPKFWHLKPKLSKYPF